MTVLEKRAGAGVDLGKMARILGSVALAAVIAFGAVYAINNTGTVETLSPAQLEKFDELNKADIGVASAAAVGAPFLAGEASQTHRGRTGQAPADSVDGADRVQMQKAASQSAAYQSSITPRQHSPE
jgi:hypothetical protein